MRSNTRGNARRVAMAAVASMLAVGIAGWAGHDEYFPGAALTSQGMANTVPSPRGARLPARTPPPHAEEGRPGYQSNIAELARRNTDFRRVVHTGDRTQLVLMSIPPGGDIGTETHSHVEQTFFFVSGEGRAEINGAATPLRAGDVLVVNAGTRHNVSNAGTEPLRLYTIYSPPNHIDGRVHATKAAAQADVQDEQFGRAAE